MAAPHDEALLLEGAPLPQKPAVQHRVFAELLNSKADLQKVTASVHDLVAVSFITHPVAHRTTFEEKRRGQLVLKWFGILRRDKGFSLSRTLAVLPYALKAELEGQGNAWEPPAERLYRGD